MSNHSFITMYGNNNTISNTPKRHRYYSNIECITMNTDGPHFHSRGDVFQRTSVLLLFYQDHGGTFDP